MSYHRFQSLDKGFSEVPKWLAGTESRLALGRGVGLKRRGLKWVIVDEMHEYRGYFGSNVAMILRRFSYHPASKGVHPQFFSSSATCANAKEHAENLTGLEFVEINASSSMRPHRQFMFVQPEIPDYRYREIPRPRPRTVKAGLACLSRGKAVLAFCPTRRFAEACHVIAVRKLEKLNGRLSVDPSTVRVFRAGLSVEERHFSARRSEERRGAD